MGYTSNLHNAKPLLERYDIPATIFVCSGYIGQARGFWWDELQQLLLQPGILPKSLCLDFNGSPCRWRLGESAHYREDDYQRYRGWQAYQDAPTPRHSSTPHF